MTHRRTLSDVFFCGFYWLAAVITSCLHHRLEEADWFCEVEKSEQSEMPPNVEVLLGWNQLHTALVFLCV